MTATQHNIPHWIRKPVKSALWSYRYATSRWRTLPHMLIIGAQKAGTSSLHAWLSDHPQILPPFEKEVHFFDDGLSPSESNYEKGLSWYRAHFPLAGNAPKISFETSPLYFFHPQAAQRIKAALPKARLIVVLRNPTERALSHYFHSLKNGVESLPLQEALAKEESRLAEEVSSNDSSGFSFVRHSYKARGRYAEQLKRYLEHFSQDQLLILDSEGLFSNPMRYLPEVFKFAGVESSFAPLNLTARNVSGNRTEVSDEVYATLNDYFRPHNQELYELIGRKFSW